MSYKLTITIEVPERAKDRAIYIMAGSENLAVYCAQTGNYWVKTTECNLCGKCCIVNREWELGWKSGSEVGWDEELEICSYLKREIWNFEPYNGQTVYICTAGSISPVGCNQGPSPLCGKVDFKASLPACSLEYEVRDVDGRI